MIDIVFQLEEKQCDSRLSTPDHPNSGNKLQLCAI